MAQEGVPSPAEYREACDYLGLASPATSGQAIITASHWLGQNGSPQARATVEQALICILRYHQDLGRRDQEHVGDGVVRTVRLADGPLPT